MYTPSHPADRPFALVVEERFGPILEIGFFASRTDCMAALDREIADLAVSDRKDTLHIYRDGRLVSSSWIDDYDELRQTGPWHGTLALDEAPRLPLAHPPFPF